MIAVKSSLFGGKQPYYARLNDGTHSYNFELERSGIFSFMGKNGGYYKPLDNYRAYYQECSAITDMIDLLTSIICQAEIFEVDKNTNKIVENSDFIKLLDNPNPFQGRNEFIKDAFIDFYTTGITMQWSNFFKNGDLRKITNNIYNINFFNIKFPKVNNRYEINEKTLSELKIKENLGNGKDRTIEFGELAYTYDIGKVAYCGNDGVNNSVFFNPISRLTPLRRDISTFVNSADTMAYISDNPVLGILSKKSVNGELNPLDGEEKTDIEAKINGKRQYGASMFGKGGLIATNTEFGLLDLVPDTRKLQLIPIQNNVKENIRSRFNVPRDVYDAVSGANRGATYENKQTAEAFLALTICGGDLDKWLQSLQKQAKGYFDRKGTKLTYSFDHMSSVQAFNADSLYKGMESRINAYKIAQEAFRTETELNPNHTSYEDFMLNLGFDNMLNHKN